MSPSKKLLLLSLLTSLISCQYFDDVTEDGSDDEIAARFGEGDCDTQLHGNERLYRGDSICSANGLFHFGINDNGDLVLISESKTLWSAGLCCDADTLNMQGDGNLVVRNKARKTLWKTKTERNAGAFLEVQDTGRAVVRLGNKELWSTGEGVDDLCPDDPDKLEPGECGCGVTDGTCSSTNGLTGTYFNDEKLTNRVLERVDTVVDFDWKTGSPDSAIGSDFFSVRWTGFVRVNQSAMYTFYTVSDDGIRLRVDEEQIIDNWTIHAPTENRGKIYLSADQFYPIEIEYYEHGGGAVAKILYSSPNLSKQTIPSSQLFTSIPQGDQCLDDPNKTEPGICGCGTADVDSDKDGTFDCNDLCPEDSQKSVPGKCGCGEAEGTCEECVDKFAICPILKDLGFCGPVLMPYCCATCSGDDDDSDLCPNDPDKTEPGVCGCGSPDTDSDGDGAYDCEDPCLMDPDKTLPGECGCGTQDDDGDGDGTADCNDDCADDPNKTTPGDCGCGVPEGNCDSDNNLSFPVRGAFYYPWYPQTWTVEGQHVFYDVDLGYYSSDDVSVIDEHIEMMEYANIEVAIASWWGPDAFTNKRIPLLLQRTKALGSSLKWAFYYEDEGFGDPSVATLSSDLDYLYETYGDSPVLARIDGKPIVFVYNADDKDCEVADRWMAANDGDWYVSLKILPGFTGCKVQPDTWHQYGPDAPAQQHSGYSYVIAPGFWRADHDEPLLTRNVDRFYQNVRDMVASGEPWQLVTTFNEWGEGTAVEPAAQWASPTGYGYYLDALHTDGIEGEGEDQDDDDDDDGGGGDDGGVDDGKDFFTIGFMPDTQYLVNDGATCKSAGLRGMFDYFVDREAELNITAVAHVGDLTQGYQYDCGKTDEAWCYVESDWTRFMDGYSVLQDANMPFIPSRGNHDNREAFDMYFPVSDYEDEPFFGGYKDNLSNAYYLFSAAGEDFIIMTIDYLKGGYPGELVNWANDVLQEYSNRTAIVVTHDYRDILNNIVRQNDNVYMVMMGHSAHDKHYTQKSVGGQTQHVFTFDYQKNMPSDCHNAVVKYFTFSPSLKKVEMRTYSVHEDRYFTKSDCYNNANGFRCQEYDFPFDH